LPDHFFNTVLTEAAEAGATRIVTSSISGFSVGDTITLAKNTPTAEVNLITEFGSMILAYPLLYYHPVGTIVEIGGTLPPTTSATTTMVATTSTAGPASTASTAAPVATAASLTLAPVTTSGDHAHEHSHSHHSHHDDSHQDHDHSAAPTSVEHSHHSHQNHADPSGMSQGMGKSGQHVHGGSARSAKQGKSMGSKGAQLVGARSKKVSASSRDQPAAFSIGIIAAGAVAFAVGTSMLVASILARRHTFATLDVPAGRMAPLEISPHLSSPLLTRNADIQNDTNGGTFVTPKRNPSSFRI
jgi:hypothetical protein